MPTPTAVFDTFWRFACERQEVYFRRLSGAPAPWTSDPILGRHRFTNAYRAADQVSQYLIQRVIYGGPQSQDEVVFRTLLFKLFNRVATWELLERAVGCPTVRHFSPDRYASPLQLALNRREPIYSAAYIMPSAGVFGSPRKHVNHLLLLDHMLHDQVAEEVLRCRTLEGVFTLLRSYPSLGDFLAYQLTIDLNYSGVLDFDEMDFVVPGPGALEGIAKCFQDLGDMDPPSVIRWVAETQNEHFDRLGLSFRSLWGRPLQLVDCQNLFCELGKYARVAHPEATPAGGRSRIKQRFRASPAGLQPWFPPKWGINDGVAAEGASWMEPTSGIASRNGRQEAPSASLHSKQLDLILSGGLPKTI